jgi:hypothetical protein
MLLTFIFDIVIDMVASVFLSGRKEKDPKN